MNQQFFYVSAGKRHGPVELDRLQKLAASGELLRTDKVWCRGMEGWQKAETVSRLFEDLPPDLPGPIVTEDSNSSAVSECPTTKPRTLDLPEDAECYLKFGDHKIGPYAFYVLKTKATNGSLKSTDLVWTPGAIEPVAASRLALSFKHLPGESQLSGRMTSDGAGQTNASAKRGSIEHPGLILGAILLATFGIAAMWHGATNRNATVTPEQAQQAVNGAQIRRNEDIARQDAQRKAEEIEQGKQVLREHGFSDGPALDVWAESAWKEARRRHARMLIGEGRTNEAWEELRGVR